MARRLLLGHAVEAPAVAVHDAAAARRRRVAMAEQQARTSVPYLFAPEDDAQLAAVPVEQVAWARRAWAVHHMPADEIAVVLGLGRMVLDQLLSAGRPDRPEATGSVYDRIPWPPDAAAALAAAANSGRERLASIGEKNVRAKLTAEQVVEIRRRVVDDGESVASIADELGLHHSSVQDLCRGVTWRHIGGPLLGAPQEVENREVSAGTGRLQRLGPCGQVLATYRSVAAAEADSGVDRVLIAADANGAAIEWRYEPGMAVDLDARPPEWLEDMGCDIVLAGESWAPITGPGTTHEQLSRPVRRQLVMVQLPKRKRVRRPADRDR